jgi:hypothetical protein
MTDYIKNYKNIRICAHAFNGNTLDKCDRICLKFAVQCADGIWRTISTDTYKDVIHYARVFNSDTIRETEQIVESPEELAEFFNKIKPKDQPAIALETTSHLFTRWARVSAKGTIAVYYHTVAESHRADVPLPDNGRVINDASSGWMGDEYCCNVFWNGADAMKSMWDDAVKQLTRLQEFCQREKAKDERELAVGANVLAKLAAFQEQSKSVEERIATTWNAMSTEDKAKALKISTTKKATAKKKAKK